MSTAAGTRRNSGLTLVVAADEANCIGADGELPWHLPNDLKHFKALTLGRPIVMGRKTYESIGRPLPGRENRVLTRSSGFAPDGVVVLDDLSQALDDDAVVIGGGLIYAQALPLAGTVELTRVHTRVDGDTFFPTLSDEQWQRVAADFHSADDAHAHAYTFETWRRRAAAPQ